MQRHNWEKLLSERDHFERWFAQNAYLLDAPAILLGDEMHSVHFDWDAAVRDGVADDRFKVLLADVNPSSFVSCASAIKLFYQQLHEYDDTWVIERAYPPVSHRNRVMMDQEGLVPVSLEGRMPFASFDVLCLSQQMIGDEVSLLYLLMRSGIPLRSHDRGEGDPLIIRGGSSSFNPSLVMDVCDLFFIGEGEDILPDLLALVEQGLRSGCSREELLLKAVQTWDCLWAPCFYEQRFSDTGELLGIFAVRDDVPERICHHHVEDLDTCFVNTKPLASYCFHSAAINGLEITRGCDGQCAFCVSGFTNLPFRARSSQRAFELLKERLYHTGEDAIQLSSFCTTSYPQLNELLRMIYTSFPYRFKALSQRIDSFHENPEFCQMLTRISDGRAIFGVEGVSQRLRQVVSKNYTEELILDTVRELCRSGYKFVKFMFVAGLPGECDQDFEELVALAQKIQAIRQEETPEGAQPTLFRFSFTPLRVFPFTPFQWLAANVEAQMPPAKFCERIEAYGIDVSAKDVGSPQSDIQVTQLLLRGDSRLQDLLIAMAQQGHLRYGTFLQEAADFVDCYLATHDMPGYDYWFAEKDASTVFPWDFIDCGATKQHLRKRYEVAVGNHPHDFPRCLDRCQGCGACSHSEQRNMSMYRSQRKEDSRLSLAQIGRQPEHGEDASGDATCRDEAPWYAVMMFTHDANHRMVHRNYWENELARALNYAGIPYDRRHLWVQKPYLERLDWAIGVNGAAVALYERMDNQELLARINEHLVNMHAQSVTWFDHAPHLVSITYQIPSPPDTDLDALAHDVKHVLESTSWEIGIEQSVDGSRRLSIREVRHQVLDLSVDGGELVMQLDPRLPPYAVYENLLGIGWDKAGCHLAVRTNMRYE
ncbi:MAG: radical SAM protein [Atopobiaceae bacterium]|nr:radical SAM protein [Atopobiaceae bacterium]